MFNSDTLANRPAAGIVGRIFIAIDSPFGIYRDTGSAWDQISGASTFSGSLATGQVAFGSATNTISGTNNLFWDAANSRLGIGTNTPALKLSVITSGGANFIQSAGFGDVSSQSGYILLEKGRGTSSSPTALLSGDILGSINFRGYYTSSNVSTTFSIFAVASSNFTSLVNPVNLIFRKFATDGNTTDLMRLVGETGNLIIQNGGTFTDGGQRLQVGGDVFIKGSGNTSATTGLTLQNSDATNILRINNAGQAIFGTNPQSIGVRLETDGIFRAWSQLEVGQFGTLAITTTQLTKGASGSDFYEFRNSSSITAPNGTYYFLQLTNSVTPTSGIAVVNGLNINFTINQTGGANGITRGIRIAPTLTSAADWRSIEWSNNTGWGIYGAGTALNYLGGTLGIKTTSPYSPSTFSLDVNGGLLVKNTAGTTAQITLINADPSIGGNNGFLVASVGGTSGGSYVDFQGYYGTSIVGSTALRLNPAGGAVIINSTTNSGEQFQLTGTLRINGQQSATSGGNSGQHLIINLDGTQYKIKLELP
jgi:hypothetical protein